MLYYDMNVFDQIIWYKELSLDLSIKLSTHPLLALKSSTLDKFNAKYLI